MANADFVTSSREPMPQLGFFFLTWRTVLNLKKCWHWAWLDTVCQYRRSKIGPLWETINILVMVLGITVVSSAVIGGDAITLAPYIGLGIIIWSFLSAVIVEGSATFVRNSNYITSTNFSIDLYVGRTVMKAIINFGHHGILYFIGLLFLPMNAGWTALLAIPGIMILFFNAYWVVTLFAFLCARFRDVELILRNSASARILCDARILGLPSYPQRQKIHHRLQRPLLLHRNCPRPITWRSSAARPLCHYSDNNGRGICVCIFGLPKDAAPASLFCLRTAAGFYDIDQDSKRQCEAANI